MGLNAALGQMGVLWEDLREISEAIIPHPDMQPNPAKLSAEDIYHPLEKPMESPFKKMAVQIGCSDMCPWIAL
jgi:hypothetical protein